MNGGEYAENSCSDFVPGNSMARHRIGAPPNIFPTVLGD